MTIPGAAALAVLLFAVAPAPAAMAQPAESDSGPFAWTVRAVTTSGARFQGILRRTDRTAPLFAEDGDQADLAAVPADTVLTIERFNGLAGSIGLRRREITSLEKLGTLSRDDVEERSVEEQAQREARWEKERARLRVVEERRAREQAEQVAAGERLAMAPDLPTLSPQEQAWIDRYPPAEGWIPARKAQLYYQTIILDNREPTDEEHAWLDHYDEWKAAYDRWLLIEQMKLQMEEAAKLNPDVAPPTGEEKPEPSGTAGTSGAAIDPAQPTPAQQQQLPPPVDPAAPKPIDVPKDAPKPAPLKPGVPAPAPLQSGDRP